MSRHRWRRLLTCWICLIVLGLELAGCGDCRGKAYSPPARGQWPTLTAYPGAEVIEQRSPSPDGQVIDFATDASRQQVEQFYFHAFEQQGWKRDATGGISDLTSCPKLWLVLTPISHAGARTTYQVSFGLEACATYC